MTTMLDDKVRGQIGEVFASLAHPVEILFFGSEDKSSCQYCAETKQLLDEVASLSDLITLSSFDNDQDSGTAAEYKIDGVPAFVLVGRDGDQRLDYGIRFKGIPAGHEFTSLINDLVLVSQRASNLSEETRAFLASLEKPVHLQVFVTPTCPYCPRSVVLAHQMALESPMVEAEMVEAMEFPELADRFNVSGVPQTTINMGDGTVIGAVPEQQLVEEIRAALSKQTADVS
jgi:glutaredoxin-like protein